jgi:DNA-binding MarR family transcriptional regulator
MERLDSSGNHVGSGETSVDQALVDALERIVVAGVAMTNSAFVRARPGLELTFPQWRVLVELGDRPDGRPVNEVSRLIAVTLPATGRQLRRLEQRGLLVLEPDPRDRRVTRARLTEAGMEARASVMADRRARIAAAVGDLEPDPRRTDDLARLAAALEQGPMTPAASG